MITKPKMLSPETPQTALSFGKSGLMKSFDNRHHLCRNSPVEIGTIFIGYGYRNAMAVDEDMFIGTLKQSLVPSQPTSLP